jgi:hypothetical protein
MDAKFDMNKWIEGKKASGQWVGSDSPDAKFHVEPKKPVPQKPGYIMKPGYGR